MRLAGWQCPGAAVASRARGHTVDYATELRNTLGCASELPDCSRVQYHRINISQLNRDFAMDLSQLRQRVVSGETFEYLFFWGHQPNKDGSVGKSCLSQWYPAPFEISGVRYLTAEHWMMAGKARLFGDEATLARILSLEHPGAAKSSGRQVQGFDQAKWMAVARRIVTEGNLAKFGQNEALGHYLLGTGDQVLVEASPHDRVWGIGLAVDDPQAQNPYTWRGENLLGFALMDAREALRD